MKKTNIAVTILMAATLLVPSFSFAATQTVSTFLSRQYTGDGGQAINAYLDMPKGFVQLADGSIMIADTINNVLRKIATDGTITTYAGTGDYGKKDGTLLASTFSEPEGIAVDADGTLFVADTNSNKIRHVTSDAVTTLAISGLKAPNAILVSGDTLYISDTANDRVVSVPKTGGTPTVIASGFTAPKKLLLVDGILYVVDIKAGTLTSVNLSTLTTSVVASGFLMPRAVTVYGGKLYLASTDGLYNEVWEITPSTGAKTRVFFQIEDDWLNAPSDIFAREVSGTPQLVMLMSGGSSVYTLKLDGTNLARIAGAERFEDNMGARADALLGRIEALAVSPDKTKMYVSYAQANKLAVVDMTTGAVSFVAGHIRDAYLDGIGGAARFSGVTAIVVSPDGKTLYLADKNNQRIRKVTVATGEASYLTGAGITNLIDPNNPAAFIDQNVSNGYAEGGPCAETFTWSVAGCAYFNRPTGLALTGDGKTLYVADSGNNKIRKVNTATGKTTFVAGSTKGFKNGKGSSAKFNGPFSLVLSKDEKTLYISDKYNAAIRALTLKTKQVTTVAGTGKGGYREGAFKSARFNLPEYITLGPDNNLYVGEAGTNRLRKLDLKKKIVLLVAGIGDRGFKNGAAPKSKWNNPKGLVFWRGTLLAADTKNDQIRAVTVAGIRVTKALPGVGAASKKR